MGAVPREPLRTMIARAIVVIVGLGDVLAGAALLFTPCWFFDSVAPFGTYNAHFLGDAGAFLLPVGVGLMVAARDLSRFRSLVILGTAVSVLHFSIHLYGSLAHGESWRVTGAVAVQAVAMVGVVAFAKPRPASTTIPDSAFRRA